MIRLPRHLPSSFSLSCIITCYRITQWGIGPTYANHHRWGKIWTSWIGIRSSVATQRIWSGRISEGNGCLLSTDSMRVFLNYPWKGRKPYWQRHHPHNLSISITIVNKHMINYGLALPRLCMVNIYYEKVAYRLGLGLFIFVVMVLAVSSLEATICVHYYIWRFVFK